MDIGTHEHGGETPISVRTNVSKNEARPRRWLLAGILDVGHQHWQRRLASLWRAGHHGMGSPLYAYDYLLHD